MKNLLLYFTCLIFSLWSSVALAQTPSAATQAACILDYLKFCNGTPLSQVRSCFTRNILQLTNTCVSSLIADGFTTREEINSVRETLRQNKVVPPPPVRKTISKRVVSVTSSVIRRVATRNNRKTATPATPAPLATPATPAPLATVKKNFPQKRKLKEPFRNEKMNIQFCDSMDNNWPGCYDRFLYD